MSFSQRIFCGELTAAKIDQIVQLCGWVDAYRDHGGLIFIHLRDRSGIIQAVFSPERAPQEVCRAAASLRNEFCVALRGQVRTRSAGTENPNLDTGLIEVMAADLTILAPDLGVTVSAAVPHFGKSHGLRRRW